MAIAKIGHEYLALDISDTDATHSWSVWRVRTIQNRKRSSGITVRYVYAILVESWTWGKRSTKAGDYGWLDPVPEWCRKKWRADEEPRGIFKTKKDAIKHELATHKKYMSPEDYDDPAMFDRITTKLENMLKRA